MSRSSVIPSFILRKVVRIYNGNIWKVTKLSSWFRGFKFGEFSKTRKHIKYKSKAMKKKTKKKKGDSEKLNKIINDPRIQSIKLIKSGELQKRSGILDSFSVTVSKKYRGVTS